MATPSAYLIQDQNIRIHYDGVRKNGISKAQKKGGGIGGREALNDISNSAKPSALQTSKKNNSANVISIGKDLDSSRNKFSVGRKDSNYPKGLEKKSGRKALADLTNSSKSSSVVEEKFLHNHQNCIKAQRKAVDMSYFLKEVGLDHDVVPVHLGASPHALKLSMKSKSSAYQTESPMKHYAEVEEMPELMMYEQVYRYEESQPCVVFSPCVASPKSAKPPYISWKDDSALDFALFGTPIQSKH